MPGGWSGVIKDMLRGARTKPQQSFAKYFESSNYEGFINQQID